MGSASVDFNLNVLGGKTCYANSVIFAETSGYRLNGGTDWRYINAQDWDTNAFGCDAPFRPDGTLGCAYQYSHVISPDTSNPANKDLQRHAGATTLGFLDGHNAVRRIAASGLPFEEWVLE